MNNNQIESNFNDFEKVNLVAAPVLVACSLFLLLVNTTRSLIALGIMSPLGLTHAQLIYYASSLLVMIFSLYALYSQHKLIYPSNIRKLFYLNLVIYIAWLVPEVVIVRRNLTTFISLALVPFSIFIFMQIPSYLFKRLLIIIILLASIVTIGDFILANNPLTFTYRESLRETISPPLIGPSRVGLIFRAFGITARVHDTACLMVVLTSYILAMKPDAINKFFRVGLLYISYLALIMTLSVSNYLAMILVTMFIFFHDILKKRFINPIFIGIPVLIFLFSFTQLETSNLGNTTSGQNIGPANLAELVAYKFTAEGVIDNFLIKDQEMDVLEELGSIFKGHNTYDKFSWGARLEFGGIKLLYLTGIVGYIVTMAILFLPLFLYINSNRFTKDQMFPYMVPIMAGILTLWHYGSLLRAPVLFVFFAFYGASIRQYLLSGYFKDHMINN